MSSELMMPSNHPILCCPLLLPPSVFPSIRVFFSDFTLHIRWSKYWSFSFSISPSSEYSGLISFKIYWLDILSVQGFSRVFSSTTVQKRPFFGVLCLLYGPTLTSVHDYWKTTALTAWTFAHKVMFLLFNTLSRFIIAFLPRSKHLLISWLQIPSAVLLEPKKRKSASFHFFPFYLPWSDGTRCHGLSFLNV